MTAAETEDEATVNARARLGTTVKNKYHLDRIVGIGGMATVYAATHRNQAELALKMLHPEFSRREDVRRRFLREGYVANSVRHRGAVLVVDDDEAEDGTAFLVMELLHGLSVEDLRERSGGRLPPRVVTWIAYELLDVLASAHANNIVHRDIKPANLFLTNEGVLKVLDFGIAQVKNLARSRGGLATQVGVLLGTPAFMAPEQATGMTDAVDAKTDIWAAGATMFMLLSGCTVHDAQNTNHMLVMAATMQARPLASLVPDVPPPLAAVVDRALAFDKNLRWPSAGAMRDALRDASAASFREGPSRDAVMVLLHPREQAPAPMARTIPFGTAEGAARPLASPAVSPAPMPRTTLSAVNDAPVVVPTSSLLPLGLALGALGVATLGAAFFVVQMRGDSRVPNPAPSSSGLLRVGLPEAAPVQSTPALAPPTHDAAPPATPKKPPPPAPKPAPQPPSTPVPPPSIPRPKLDCAIPYVLNPDGSKKWKTECLK